MQMCSLKYLSEFRLEELRQEIATNRERYRNGDFLDLSQENGWEIESSLVNVNTDALSELDRNVYVSGRIQTSEVDARNSAIVYEALQGMTPALAVEERIWARLTHIECLKYTRSRWLYRADSLTDEQFDNQVYKHFFSPTLNGVRDDNAISRLWWNMHIATMLSPESPTNALGFMLKIADVRSNLVERSWTGARLPLSRAIVRFIEREPWLTAHQDNFRAFMKVLNRDGGGVLFEALPDSVQDQKVEILMNSCLQKAKISL